MYQDTELEFTRVIRIREDRYIYLSKLAKKLKMTRNKVLEVYLSEIMDMDKENQGFRLRVNVAK